MEVIITSDIKMLLHLLRILRRFTSYSWNKYLLQQHDVSEKYLDIPGP